MPHSDKMGNGVRGFLAYIGWYGGGGGMEKAFGVFLSGNIVFPCLSGNIVFPFVNVFPIHRAPDKKE